MDVILPGWSVSNWLNSCKVMLESLMIEFNYFIFCRPPFYYLFSKHQDLLWRIMHFLVSWKYLKLTSLFVLPVSSQNLFHLLLNYFLRFKILSNIFWEYLGPHTNEKSFSFCFTAIYYYLINQFQKIYLAVNLMSALQHFV